MENASIWARFLPWFLIGPPTASPEIRQGNCALFLLLQPKGQGGKRNENIVVASVQDPLVLDQIAVQDSEGHFQWCKRQV